MGIGDVMTVAAIRPPSLYVEEQPQFMVLENISWDLYIRLHQAIDASARYFRITYDDGSLVLTSPIGRTHERVKTLVRRLIENLTLELDIPIEGLGSLTQKRKSLRKGLEPDECYYIQHCAEAVRQRKSEVRKDLPPDLAIEIDVTHYPIDREAIYAALGVGELWRYRKNRVEFFKLSAKMRYEKISTSRALPISVEDVNRFVAMLDSTLDQTSIIRAFREWIRSNQK
jgi:Uma2 family endonuclease